MQNRIFLSKSGVMTDLSTSLKEYKTLSSIINLTNADYIYIGQSFPFNHVFMKVKTPNIISATLSIEYFDGKDWRSVAEIIDETNLLGKPFGQSGFIQWTPDKNFNWNYADTVRGNNYDENITGMGSVKVYDLFWIRLKVSTTITATTELKWIGNLFSNDSDLFGEHPELNKTSFLTSIETGKTDYEEQHVIAAKAIIDDLSVTGDLLHNGQILDRDDFRLMSVSKTAQIIYNMLGADYFSYRDECLKEYSIRKNKKNKKIDLQLNARLDQTEISYPSSNVVRR